MAQSRPPVPRLTDPSKLKPPTNRLSQDLDERFLLTPPAAEAGSQNPFDQPNALNQSPVHLSKLLEQNAQAYWHNSHITANRSGTPPAAATTHLLQGLQLRTDMPEMRRSGSEDSTDSDWKLRTSTSAGSLPLRVPGMRNRLQSAAGSLSPGSVISSPMIAAMLDITPLPSPTMGPTEWRSLMRTRSRASSTSSRASRSDFGPSLPSQGSPRRKNYGLLHTNRKSSMSDDVMLTDEPVRDRTRSISEYVPEAMHIHKPRQIAVSGTGPSKEVSAAQAALHREDFLAVQRGIFSSNAEFAETFETTKPLLSPPLEDESTPQQPKADIWTAQSIHTGATKAYEMIRPLGQGTFSKVYLAVRLVHDRKDSVDYRQPSRDMAGVRARSRRLVAIKVVEPGPAGGADAERIEISLKREVEIMKSVMHPCIIHLKSFGTEPNGRALLVMNYCPGGDLFELASQKLHVLTPALVRRIFSELVSAVRYLHQKYIVHRDIKLENVLLNIPVEVHGDVANWQTLDRAVITLTDLGLSRTIPQPPESPLLETRCGSEDYAAPEILMGQPYDGRQTDAWALGVLLYALMEGRLPFDPIPGARGDPATLRARTPHRIARCEWQWVRYGDSDGDWDEKKGKELKGACECVDSLLKRSTRRKPLSEIRELPWVAGGIQVDGGLRWVEEEGI